MKQPTPTTRLHKWLSQITGLSRRAAEVAIARGEVRVNGRNVTDVAAPCRPGRDRIEWRGERCAARARPRHEYLAFYKPKQVVTTRHDPQGRRTVWDLIPERYHHCHIAGRLDYDSEGLLLLTDDGACVQRVTHPSRGVVKHYQVKVSGLAPEPIERMTAGIRDAGETLQATAARWLRGTREAAWIEVALREGKNREIRRMIAALGGTTLKLKRLALGPLRLGPLKPGDWRKLTPKEINALR